MQEHLKYLLSFVSSPTVGAFIGLASFGMAFPFYLWSRKVVTLFYDESHASIASKSSNSRFSDDLVVTYKGNPVPIVTSSQYVIWNGGNQTLKAGDIAPADPLKLQLPEDTQFLSGEVLWQSNGSNRIQLDTTEDGRVTYISFDFLEPREGFECEVVHTGSRRSIEFSGTIMGSPRSPRASDAHSTGKMVSAALCILGGMMFLVAVFFPSAWEPEWLSNLSTFLGQPIVAGYVAATLFAVAAIQIVRYKARQIRNLSPLALFPDKWRSEFRGLRGGEVKDILQQVEGAAER